MKRILITGGAGFVGKNLIQLLRDKYIISVMDNLSKVEKFQFESSADITFLNLDVRNYEQCVLATKNIDIVIHLAAYGSVVESIENPFDNYDNNVNGTFNILQASAKNSVKRVVFASTGGALMGDCILPVSEMTLPRPISPYGASKLAGEGYCHAYAKSFGISITILRFANLYGPYSLHKKGLINKLLQAVTTQMPIEIYGNASRDFLYVEDLCAGIEKVLEVHHENSEIFHMASGVESKIVDVVNMFLSVSGHENHPIVHKISRMGEVERNFASFSKAKEVFDFNPQTSLQEGLKKTWEWFNNV